MSEPVFLTLIIPDSQVVLTREIAAAIDSGAEGMWITPLSPTGDEPATNWVSTGWLPEAWQQIVPTQTWEYQDGTWVKTSETPGNPIFVYQKATEAGISCTQAEVDAIFASADITSQDPWAAFSRLGLSLVQTSSDG